MTVGRAAVREEPRPWWGEVAGSGGDHPGEVGGGRARREGHVAEHQISRAAGPGAVHFLSHRGRSPGAVQPQRRFFVLQFICFSLQGAVS